MYIRILFLLLLFFGIVSCSSVKQPDDISSADYIEQVEFEDTNAQTGGEELDEIVIKDKSGFSWWNPATWFSSSDKEDSDKEDNSEGNNLENNEEVNIKNTSESSFVIEGEADKVSKKAWYNPFTWGSNKTEEIVENSKNDEDNISLSKEEKEMLRVSEIDKDFVLQSNIMINYYGLPIAIIRMPSDWGKEQNEESVFHSLKKSSSSVSKLGKNENISNAIQSDQDMFAGEKNEEDILKKHEEVDKIIKTNLEYRDSAIKHIILTEQHKKTLSDLVSEVKGSSNKIIIIFIKGYDMKNWDSSAYNIERAIYVQYVVSYLYSNFNNIRIEKRYIDSMPSDEIFMVALNYEGSLGYNMYNAPKQSITQWLARYRDIELEKIKKETQDKKEIEALISGSTALSPERGNNN